MEIKYEYLVNILFYWKPQKKYIFNSGSFTVMHNDTKASIDNSDNNMKVPGHNEKLVDVLGTNIHIQAEYLHVCRGGNFTVRRK